MGLGAWEAICQDLLFLTDEMAGWYVISVRVRVRVGCLVLSVGLLSNLSLVPAPVTREDARQWPPLQCQLD